MRLWPWVALALTIVIAACNGKFYVGAELDDIGRRETVACPVLPERETMVPPPGVYTNHRITIEYARLVPRSDPRKNIDLKYANYVRSNPELLEQVYHDATDGNARASWFICHLEVRARNYGRDMARFLSRLSCQALFDCKTALRDAMLPISDETASGQRLLTFIGREFEKEATRISINQSLISDALTLMIGLKIASVIRPGARLFSVIPGGVRGFGSMRSFRRAMGSAGPGMEWHHIVEQTPGNIARFGPRAIHNTRNVVRLDKEIHREISRHYSSKLPTQNQTVRQKLSTESFEVQRNYGLEVLRDHGVIVP